MTDAVKLAELTAAKNSIRHYVNQTAYGGWISDDLCSQLAGVVVAAVDDARAKAQAALPKPALVMRPTVATPA